MEKINTRRLLLNVALILSLFLLALDAIFFAITALHNVIHFNGPALDGAFQLLNPLRRLDAGEVVGRDFQFFHGPLVPLIHYPLYKLLGGGLFGSEISRWLMSPLLFVLSGFIFMFAWFHGVNSRSSRLKLSAIGLAMLIPITYMAADVVTPSNSLMGVRTTFPLILAAVMLLKPFSARHLKYKAFSISFYSLILYTLIALSIACGTEQGIAALLAYIAVASINSFRGTYKRPIKLRLCEAGVTALRNMLGASIVTFILFSLISIGHPLRALQYVLIDIPKDQFWYFSAYPQGFLTYHNILADLTLPYMLAIYAWIGSFVILLFITYRLSIISADQKRAIFFLATYALVTNGTMLGYFFGPQTYPTVRVVVLLDITFSLTILSRMLSAKAPKCPRYFEYFATGLISLMVVTTALTANSMWVTTAWYSKYELLRDSWHYLLGDHSQLLGSMWASGTARIEGDIHTKARSAHPILWSTYTSIIELDLGQLNPSTQGHDYIIHALGPERRAQYAKDFISSKPDFVTTIRPSYSIFEEWLWPRNWDFYRHLIQNYTIIDVDTAHFLWQRNTTTVQPTTRVQPLDVTKPQHIILPKNTTDTYRLVEVTVDYRPASIWGRLPFAKDLPRYLIQPAYTNNKYAIALPPYEHEWQFPIILQPHQEQQPYLDAYTDGLLPSAKYTITSANYRYINIDPANLPEFTETTATAAND